MRIMFALKYREGYWGQIGSDLSSGLKNSVTFIVDMLNDMGHVAVMIQFSDNNKIDAAIHAFRPDLVVLEAFWVVPEKLDVLIPKWPKVKWAFRNHSDIAFISGEGIAMEWLYGYWSRGLNVMSNDPVAVRDLATIGWSYGGQKFYDLNSYAPNYYPLDKTPPIPGPKTNDGVVDVGCFGALRPLKAQLSSAIGAIQFCQQSGRPLRFHCNTTRIEQYGGPVLRNLRSLFAHARNAELVEHPWLDHDPFLELMSQMNVSMAISFSETFCITAADSVAVGVPVIGSSEIPWTDGFDVADPMDTGQMVWRLMQAEMYEREWTFTQWKNLKKYDAQTRHAWHQTLKLFE